MNRKFFAQQTAAEQRFIRPLAHLYRMLTPGPIGVVIHNFVTNLTEPAIVANDILQGRGKRAVHDTERLVLNSTFGLGGIVDVATPNGLPHQDNDFGVTLGRWGVGPGPYLYLPLLGPSTLRDAIGKGVDSAANPFNYVRFPYRITVVVGTTVASGLDLRVQTEGEEDALLADATDPYATLRSVYLQQREQMIRGEETAPTLPPMDDELDKTAPSPSAGLTLPARDVAAVLAGASPATAIAPPVSPQAEPELAQDPDVSPDPDGVIITARRCDLDGAPAAHGA
jgi:phospholipid-binding lipoprotein MlaA